MNQTLIYKGVAYSLRHLTETPEGQEQLADAAKTGTRLICDCNSLGLRVQAKRFKGRHYTSREQNTGHLHDYACDDYKGEDDFERQQTRQKTMAAFTPGEWGIDVAINVSMTQDLSEPCPSAVVIHGTGNNRGEQSQNRTTLMGALCYAVQESGLTRYDPKYPPPCQWTTASKKMEQIFQRMWFGQNRIADRLIFPRIHNAATVANRLSFLQQNRSKSRKEFGLVVGNIVRVEDHEDHSFVSVWLEYHASPFLISRAIWNAAIKFGFSANARVALSSIEAGNPDASVLLIARCEVTEDGAAYLQNVNLMVTSKEWIPVQSSYELMVAKKLVMENATFRKPLFARDGFPYVPDFIRETDLGDAPMEVAGMMNKPKYVEHLNKKLAVYPTFFNIPCWVWYAKPDQDVPSF